MEIVARAVEDMGQTGIRLDPSERFASSWSQSGYLGAGRRAAWITFLRIRASQWQTNNDEKAIRG